MNTGKVQGVWLSRNLARHKGQRGTGRYNHPTESGDVIGRIGEDIPVFRPPPKVKNFSSGLHVQNILRRNSERRESRSNATSTRGTRRNQGGSYLSGRVIEIKARRQLRTGKLAFGVHRHVSSGGVAAVFPYWSEPPIVITSYRIDLPHRKYINSENKGSLSRHHSVASDIGSASTLFEGEPKKNCLYRNGEEL